MSDTKTILEKRIEERADQKIRAEILKAIELLPRWILGLYCVKNGGGDNETIEEFLRGVSNKNFRTFPFPKVEEKREEMKQKYMREETDKFLTQIDLVKQLTDEVSQYREPEQDLSVIPF